MLTRAVPLVHIVTERILCERCASVHSAGQRCRECRGAASLFHGQDIWKQVQNRW